MKTKQVNPMPAFVGSGFDCEWNMTNCPPLFNCRWQIIPNWAYRDEDVRTLDKSYFHRPRLNNPQVLPDWGWLDNPLLDGFVWGDWADQTFSSKEIATYYKQGLLRKPISFHICGVEKGSQLEDWAKANDVPVYDENMEVVK